MADQFLVNYRLTPLGDQKHRHFPQTAVCDTESEAEAFCEGLHASDPDPTAWETQILQFDDEETPDQPDYGWWDEDRGGYEDEFFMVVGGPE